MRVRHIAASLHGYGFVGVAVACLLPYRGLTADAGGFGSAVSRLDAPASDDRSQVR
jgi:hypothetical protein